MYFFISLLVIARIDFIYSDICADQNWSCEGCLMNDFGCLWCADEVHNDTRCRLPGNPIVTPSWCENIMRFVREPVRVLKNEEYRPRTNDTEAVQLKPQHIDINARPESSIHFTMSYKPTIVYPVDVYFIFDDSKTMKMYQNLLKAQVTVMYDALKDISGDVRFGVGKLDARALSQNSDSIFRSSEGLTEDMSKIVGILNQDEIVSTTNMVLEGLIQALESRSIKLLNDARRSVIVLFCDVSNASQDINKRDINKNVKKINQIATMKGTHIIFTGFKHSQEEYKALAGKISGASYIELEDKSDDDADIPDLVNLIKDAYVNAVHTLELVGILPAYLSLKIMPECERFGNRCLRRVLPGNILKLPVTVRMFDCSTVYRQRDNGTIKVIGTRENLTISTTILCECTCQENLDTKSKKCSLMGDYSCGICKCYNGRYGDSCQCVGDYFEDGWKKCKAGPHDFYQSGCNGQGDCICGVCHCSEGYTGEHCTESTT